VPALALGTAGLAGFPMNSPVEQPSTKLRNKRNTFLESVFLCVPPVEALGGLFRKELLFRCVPNR
jgi:hypothetical protein